MVPLRVLKYNKSLSMIQIERGNYLTASQTPVSVQA